MIPGTLGAQRARMSRSAVLGFNHNLRHGGCLFHVQTEDSGEQLARIHTHVFLEGRVVHARRESYGAGLDAGAVRTRMKQQHHGVLRAVTEGELDALLPFAAHRTPPHGVRAFPEVVPAPSTKSTTAWERLKDTVRPVREPAPFVMLRVDLASREAFLKAYFQGHRADGLFIETTVDVPLGSIVGVDVRVVGIESRRFTLRGRVTWRRHRGGGGLKQGIGVEFLEQDTAMHDRLLAFMRPRLDGIDDDGPCWMGGRVHAVLRASDGGAHAVELVELRPGGARVRGADGLRVGEEALLVLKRGRLVADVLVRALVVWRDDEGAGLELLHETAEGDARLRALISSWNRDPAPSGVHAA